VRNAGEREEHGVKEHRISDSSRSARRTFRLLSARRTVRRNTLLAPRAARALGARLPRAYLGADIAPRAAASKGHERHIMKSTMETKTKELRSIERRSGRHWVGDGFPVRTLLAYPEHGARITPFLLLDYAGPAEFPPTERKLGVGEHPHRGFETVTIVYQGEVEHRDSAGGGGRIGPGDVQWMTAASGLVHEEFHGAEYARRGGPFEMVQLWVNLPAAHKRDAPRYQAITSAQIPTIELPEQRGRLRVIAGEHAGRRGPAQTFTPMNVWDLRIEQSGRTELGLPEGWTTVLVVLGGSLRANGSEPIETAEVGLFGREGTRLVLEGEPGTRALLLAGEPIDEPIVGSGPFVMNTAQEIHQAMADYSAGRMGHLS